MCSILAHGTSESVLPSVPPDASVEQKLSHVVEQGKDGTVGQVTVLKAPAGKLGFDREAMAALRQWIFQPGEMHGQPVDVIMTLTVKFRLSR